MKTVLLLLFVVMIGFGFLLSDNIHTRDEMAQMQQANSQLSSEKEALQTQLDTALANLAQSEQTLNELRQQSLLKEETIRQLDQQVAVQKQQIADLQRKVDALQIITPIKSSLPDALSLIFFLPVIPVSIAATYILVRFKDKHAPQENLNKAQRRTGVQLTDNEIKEVIKLRRKQ